MTRITSIFTYRIPLGYRRWFQSYLATFENTTYSKAGELTSTIYSVTAPTRVHKQIRSALEEKVPEYQLHTSTIFVPNNRVDRLVKTLHLSSVTNKPGSPTNGRTPITITGNRQEIEEIQRRFGEMEGEG